eukprot:g4557.t1
MALLVRTKRVSTLLPHLLPFGTALQTVSFTTSRKVLADSSDPPVPKPVPLKKLKDSFLYGTSSAYLEELETRYNADPKSVDKTWAAFFKSLEQGVNPEAVAEAYHAFERGETLQPLRSASLTTQTVQESLKLMTLIRSFQVYGHFEATLDPLGIDKGRTIDFLRPEFYGFGPEDYDREFALGTIGLGGFLAADRPVISLKDIVSRLREIYCGDIGYEYMHIENREKCNWLRERLELITDGALPKAKKIHILDRLAWSEMFEEFLRKKYSAAKRFGLEGCSSLIPGMKAAIDKGAEKGVESVVIGMAHRGRLNVLANVVRKPMRAIFHEFTGAGPEDGGDGFGSGDVKYHLGTSYDRPTLAGTRLHLSLVANPSHLEAVDPVVMGKTRAKQFYSGDHERTRHLPILLHGDGSFSGQGIVYETFHMSDLPDYTVGGTLHIVLNNQIAFTTDPNKSRSSPYCTDVAKATSAPVFHVNGDNVEAVVKVCELAAEWRQKKYGHNEIDEPMFTHPLMYNIIRNKKKNAFELYQDRLLKERVIDKGHISKLKNEVNSVMSREYNEATDYKSEEIEWLSSRWEGFKSPQQMARIRSTGVKLDILKQVGNVITTLPSDLITHPLIKKIYEDRHKMINKEESMGQLDWAMAEGLAFGTLLSEGNHIRLSGQDVERGTFSHRHAVIHDQKTGDKYTPLSHVFRNQEPNHFTVCNSSLSEFGVLGFELGYSLENPNALVLWEAQFGDFANGAQVIVDQFIAAGEAKWNRQSGLVLLLPHGYDGQGPEHSSARLERYLQMSNEDPDVMPEIEESQWFNGGHLGSQIQDSNFQVVNCTTPVNYFHIHREFRKPLFVVSPKNLLRHPSCTSYLWEFDDIPDDVGILGVRFKRVIMDDKGIMPKSRSPNPDKEPNFKRLVFCSGKIFFELHKARELQKKEEEIALVRIEQLAPFPFDLVCRELKRYSKAEVIWCQEEPENMGAYRHIEPRMYSCLRKEGRDITKPLKYAGRKASPSPATGFYEVHKIEQKQLIDDALNLEY